MAKLLRRCYLRLPLCLKRSAEEMEPSIHGMFRPFLVWPEQLSERLNDEHIEVLVVLALA